MAGERARPKGTPPVTAIKFYASGGERRGARGHLLAGLQEEDLLLQLADALGYFAARGGIRGQEGSRGRRGVHSFQRRM